MRHISDAGSEDRPLALVVARDPDLRAAVRGALEAGELATLGVASADEGRRLLRDESVDLLLVAAREPAGVQLLGDAVSLEPGPVVVAIGDDAPGELDDIESRLFDVIPADPGASALRRLGFRAQREVNRTREIRRLRRELQSREGFHRIVGRSPAMERVRRDVARLASLACPVWLAGEPGTGKELVARTLHASSVRRGGPFVVLHCSTLAAGSESVRWVAGNSDAPGWLEQAAGGVLYLEDVTELAPAVQDQLAQLLDSERHDVRIFCASPMDPEQARQARRLGDAFRQRAALETIHLPSLLDRGEDVPLLARHFIHTVCEINRLPPIQLDAAALECLERHSWPGNVRELRNAMEHAVTLAVGGTVRAQDLPDRVREGRGTRGAGSLASRSFREAKQEVVAGFERQYLSELLARFDGNVTAASQQAGMLRSALQRLLRKHGLKSADFRSGAGRGSRAARRGARRQHEPAS